MRIRITWEYAYPKPVVTDDGEVGYPEEYDVEDAVSSSKVYDKILKALKTAVEDAIEEELERKPKVSMDGGLTEATVTIGNKNITDKELNSIMKEAVHAFKNERFDVKVGCDLTSEDDEGETQDVYRKITLEVSPGSVKWKKL